jgi:large subunit ribosomal protein L19
MNKIEKFNKEQLKKGLDDIRPGDTIKVHQKIKEKDKQRIQVFEGLVLARKHGKGISATITVRKLVSGIGVERVFPLHSPNIEKIEIVKRGKVRRAKLYYLRKAKGRKARLKKVDFEQSVIQETKEPAQIEEKKEVQEKPEENQNN